jgi:hypothetical protein
MAASPNVVGREIGAGVADGKTGCAHRRSRHCAGQDATATHRADRPQLAAQRVRVGARTVARDGTQRRRTYVGSTFSASFRSRAD